MQNLLGGLIQVQLLMMLNLCEDSIRVGPFKEEKEDLELQMVSRMKWRS
jgi:hypothetical protein